jgi:hypothetical protein
MPTLRELLNRFRPAGTPGAPGGAAVPADRVAELAAELAPVFEALTAARAEADAIRAASVTQAGTRRAETAATVASILAAAHRATDAERAAGYTAAWAGGEAAAAALMRDGHRAAGAVRRRVRKRSSRLVGDLVVAALAQVELTPERSVAPSGVGPAQVAREVMS